jgi:hypothetical protein
VRGNAGRKGPWKLPKKSLVSSLGEILHSLSVGTVSNIPVLADAMIKSVFSFNSEK